ncbi:hypothetical protein D9Q81_02815 [Candidatus Korarchaeum cryptofilum]|jgi:hypothetical protein|uniref:Uncharacterized protein n=1 Tax=Candidatus Korarchaeum cryptofilum TaxID=498846 RepID=A0A429G6Y1_9CREN|nr:hypothetical protein [Candidatus Korarchaeum cryptofilum]RSN69553.1 hypothetical protein D9Q81_02815 [Candidatus Korarchaeum cryptofilum]
MSGDHKFEIQIIKQNRAMRVEKEYKERMKELYGDKIVSKFSKDAVECPIFGKTVSFLICMGCPNYVRRFKGVVHCKGESIANPERS